MTTTHFPLYDSTSQQWQVMARTDAIDACVTTFPTKAEAQARCDELAATTNQQPALTGYARMIALATGKSDPTMLVRIEETMRNDIVHSTLDWLNPRQFTKAARDAVDMIDFMESPEGIAYLKSLKEQFA